MSSPYCSPYLASEFSERIGAYRQFLADTDIQLRDSFWMITPKGTVSQEDLGQVIAKISDSCREVLQARRQFNQCGHDAKDLAGRLTKKQYPTNSFFIFSPLRNKTIDQIHSPWANPGYMSPIGDTYHQIVHTQLGSLEVAIDLNFARRQSQASGQIFVGKSAENLQTMVKHRYCAGIVIEAASNWNCGPARPDFST